MAKKQQLIDYARKLFLEYDSEGKKAHSLRDIAKKVGEKFSRNLANTTVLNWSKKYEWDRLNARIKQQSIEKATEEKFTKEEQLIDEESNKLAKDYRNAEKLADIGFQVMFDALNKKENTLFDRKEALAAIRLGIDIKFRINEMPENKKENKVTQSFKIGSQEIIF